MNTWLHGDSHASTSSSGRDASSSSSTQGKRSMTLYALWDYNHFWQECLVESS